MIDPALLSRKLKRYKFPIIEDDKRLGVWTVGWEPIGIFGHGQTEAKAQTMARNSLRQDYKYHLESVPTMVKHLFPNETLTEDQQYERYFNGSEMMGYLDWLKKVIDTGKEPVKNNSLSITSTTGSS